MAFDDTVGGPSSNSYSTLADANEYYVTRDRSELWDALTTDASKEKKIVTATQSLENYIDWNGTISTDTQALFFPASGVTDKWDRDVSDSIIPLDVQKMLYEQIYWELQLDATIDPVIANVGLSSADAGVKVDIDTSALPDRLAPFVVELSKSYGNLRPGAVNSSISIINVLRA